MIVDDIHPREQHHREVSKWGRDFPLAAFERRFNAYLFLTNMSRGSGQETTLAMLTAC